MSTNYSNMNAVTIANAMNDTLFEPFLNVMSGNTPDAKKKHTTSDRPDLWIGGCEQQ